MGASNVANIFLGRTEEEREALARIIEREDDVFRLQANESDSLANHVHADIPRFALLNDRAKLNLATQNRKSDRNLYATVGIGIVLFIKTGITWSDLVHFFASL